MPHIHLLVWVEHPKDIPTAKFVDQYVTARVPHIPFMHDFSPEANQQRRLWNYATSFMMHDCNKACLTEKTEDGKMICTKGFPKSFTDHTEISGNQWFL